MKHVNFHNLQDIDELATPDEYIDIELNSPALKVFTDFKYVNPYTIDSTISAFEVEKMMIQAHVKLKFVVNKNKHFLGVVSLDNLNRQNMVRKVANGENIKELSVSEFMIPRDSLKAIEYSDLAGLSIHDVITALQDNGEQHCLVLESNKHRIRGIISASDVARKLHIPLNLKTDSSFVNIFKSIRSLN